jgi:hypothetical protein
MNGFSTAEERRRWQEEGREAHDAGTSLNPWRGLNFEAQTEWEKGWWMARNRRIARREDLQNALKTLNYYEREILEVSPDPLSLAGTCRALEILLAKGAP